MAVSFATGSLWLGVNATTEVPRIGQVYVGSPMQNWANVWEARCAAQVSSDDPQFAAVDFGELFPSGRVFEVKLPFQSPEETDEQTYIASGVGDTIFLVRTNREKGQFNSSLYQGQIVGSNFVIQDSVEFPDKAITDVESNGSTIAIAYVFMNGELMHLGLETASLGNFSKVSDLEWRRNFESQPGIDPSVTPANPGQGGGHILFTGGQEVLLSVGDFRLGPSTLAEQLTAYDPKDFLAPKTDYGATHLINFVSGESSLFTYGNRNPLGLAIDSEGQIWESEHAAGEGNEINLLEVGNDYGWGDGTRGIPYGGFANLRNEEFARAYLEKFPDPLVGLSRFCRSSELDESTDPEIVLSGSGNHPPGELEVLAPGFGGNNAEILLLATMKSRSLVAMEISNGKVIGGRQAESTWRFRDIALDGERVIITTDEDGPLIIIED